MKKTMVFAITLLMLPLLGGCAAALVGAGATGGYYTAKNKKEVGQYADDSVITGKLKAKYLKDFSLKSLNISVATNKGVVTLSGSVSTKTIRQHAIGLAKQTGGVKSVDATSLVVNTRK